MAGPDGLAAASTAEARLESVVMLEEPPRPNLWRWRWSLPAIDRPLLLSAIAVALTLLGGWWVAKRAEVVEREVVRRLQGAERNLADTGSQLRQATDALRDSQNRLAALEAKLSDSVAQQAQLERLYQELAQSRNDAVLAEVESTMVSASQQLQLGGNVRAALLALQDADARLDRIRLPPQSPIRRAVAADLVLLRQAEAVDVGALAAKLETISEGIDKMPLLSEPRVPGKPDGRASPQVKKPTATIAEASGSASGSPLESASDSRLSPARIAALLGLGPEGWTRRLADWSLVFQELGHWVRVRRIDRPDAMLLAPEQAWFVRENLKLRLAQARWALLTRNDVVLRFDLEQAAETLEHWFDRDQGLVAQAILTLGQIRSVSSNVPLPSIHQSLSAIRLVRAAREPG
jgi:uroporphyrin-3 C-methyltransferase/uroporphyrinogen III methyltransferase/synthase